MDSLDKKQDILESYHNGGDFYSLFDRPSVASGGSITHFVEGQQWEDAVSCNPNNFIDITFKHPYDFSKVSASGSCAFGQLSIPSLRVKVGGTTAGASNFSGGNTGGAATVDLHVIAYTTTLISYNTNTSGSTNLRMIQN